MAICDSCRRNEHNFCTDVPHPDVEMTFVACDCLHDPILTQRDAQVTALLVAAQIAFGRGDDEATKTALRRCLAVLDGRPEKPAPAKPMRKFHLVGCGRRTDEEYAAASGEPIEPWMLQTHDGEKR
jgi:hypothetical protein